MSSSPCNPRALFAGGGGNTLSRTLHQEMAMRRVGTNNASTREEQEEEEEEADSRSVLVVLAGEKPTKFQEELSNALHDVDVCRARCNSLELQCINYRAEIARLQQAAIAHQQQLCRVTSRHCDDQEKEDARAEDNASTRRRRTRFGQADTISDDEDSTSSSNSNAEERPYQTNKNNKLDNSGNYSKSDDEMYWQRTSPVSGRHPSFPQRHRMQQENSRVAQELAAVIIGFWDCSDYLNDRRKFPENRIAKIIVESIVSFGGMSGKIAKLSSQQVVCDYGGDVQSLLKQFLMVKMRGCNNKSKATLLINCLWDETILDRMVQGQMVERVSCHLRDTVFSPWKILKAMDIAGFNISLAGLEVLRQVEGER